MVEPIAPVAQWIEQRFSKRRLNRMVKPNVVLDYGTPELILGRRHYRATSSDLQPTLSRLEEYSGSPKMRSSAMSLMAK
jgi:hypothetical protein